MSEETAEQPVRPSPRPRKRAPKWLIPAFLGVLVLLLVVNHLVEHSGTPVVWIDNDVDRALTLAQEQKKRVFLYLYKPSSETHARNESEVFSKRWARDPLAEAVCCRVDVTKNPSIGLRYGYKGTPLMLVLAPDGRELARVDAPVVEELQFRTYVTAFIMDPNASKQP